jgi:transcription elongation factor GreA-like protein
VRRVKQRAMLERTMCEMKLSECQHPKMALHFSGIQNASRSSLQEFSTVTHLLVSGRNFHQEDSRLK